MTHHQIEPCDLHEMIGCTICSGKDKQVVPDHVERVMRSRYESRCPRCHKRIALNQRIWLADEEWICCPVFEDGEEPQFLMHNPKKKLSPHAWMNRKHGHSCVRSECTNYNGG